MRRALLYVFAFCYCVCSTAQNLFANHAKNNLEPNPSLIKETGSRVNLTNSNVIKYNLTENNDNYNNLLDDLNNNKWYNCINLLSKLILCAIFVLLISVIFI